MFNTTILYDIYQTPENKNINQNQEILTDNNTKKKKKE